MPQTLEEKFNERFAGKLEDGRKIYVHNHEELMAFIHEALEEVINEIPNKRSDLGQGFGSIKDDLFLLKQQLTNKYLK